MLTGNTSQNRAQVVSILTKSALIIVYTGQTEQNSLTTSRTNGVIDVVFRRTNRTSENIAVDNVVVNIRTGQTMSNTLITGQTGQRIIHVHVIAILTNRTSRSILARITMINKRTTKMTTIIAQKIKILTKST